MIVSPRTSEMPCTSWIYVADNSVRDPPAASWNATDSEGPAERRPRVLVVDDERIIADTVTDILEGAGFEATAAYDGWTALVTADRFRPDYLLSDVAMPRMNGVELAIAMRNIYPRIKILLFSGQTGISEMLAAGQNRGFDFDLVAKPIYPLRLIERLKGESFL